MKEETLQAAREAWNRDPETAAQALLGVSAEEIFITALRGCNQHKHKPGCPDADGVGDKEANKTSFSDEEDFRNKARAAYKNGNLDKLIKETKWDKVENINRANLYFTKINGQKVMLVKYKQGRGADYVAKGDGSPEFLDPYLYKTPQEIAKEEGISVPEAFNKAVKRKRELGE